MSIRDDIKVRRKLTYEEILQEIKDAVGETRFKETYPLVKVLASSLLEEQEYWLEMEGLLFEDISKDDFKRREALSKRRAGIAKTAASIFKIIGFSPEEAKSKMEEFDEKVKEEIVKEQEK